MMRCGPDGIMIPEYGTYFLHSSLSCCLSNSRATYLWLGYVALSQFSSILKKSRGQS